MISLCPPCLCVPFFSLTKYTYFSHAFKTPLIEKSFTRKDISSRVRSYNVLLVDDFEPFRRVVREMLEERNDFRISVAADGLEAVRQAQKLQPDLVLLDIGLPKLNGIQAAVRIQEISPNSKILFCTQESSAEVVREALRLGAHGYLLKSDAAEELLPAMDQVLEGRRFVSRRLKL